MLKMSFRLIKPLPFVRIFSRKFNYWQNRIVNGIESLKDVSFRGSLIGLVYVMIVWVAVFLYIAFYYAYMPSISHIRPVNLEFNACQSSEVCSYPTALVRLTRRQQLLMVGQTYKIVIHLEMPESSANRDLGMFMVCARLKNYENCKTSYGQDCECSKSCRSTMLHYRSFLLQALTTLALSPFMVFGNTEEKQIISVELFTEFEDDQTCPVTEIEVQILSRRVEWYSAKLGIHAHLTGLRYLMYHWPITSFIVGVCCNLFFIFFIVSLSWWRLSQNGSLKDHQYKFSVASYIKKKSDYEPIAEEETEDSVMVSETLTPVVTPKLKKRSKISLSVPADSFDDELGELIETPEKLELSQEESSKGTNSEA